MSWKQDENGHLERRAISRPDPSPGFQAVLGIVLVLLILFGSSAFASCGIWQDELLRSMCEEARAEQYNAEARQELEKVQGLPGFRWLDRMRRDRARLADPRYRRDSNQDAILRCAQRGRSVDFVTGRCQ